MQRLYCCCHSHRRQRGVDGWRRWTSVSRPGQRGPSVCRVSAASILPNDAFPQFVLFPSLITRFSSPVAQGTHQDALAARHRWEKPVPSHAASAHPERYWLLFTRWASDSSCRRVVWLQHVICWSGFICSLLFSGTYAFTESPDKDATISLMFSCQMVIFPMRESENLPSNKIFKWNLKHWRLNLFWKYFSRFFFVLFF